MFFREPLRARSARLILVYIYIYIYRCVSAYVYMRVSCLLSSHVKLAKVTPPHPRLSFDKWALYAYICLLDSFCLSAGLSLCYVWDLVGAMCGL